MYIHVCVCVCIHIYICIIYIYIYICITYIYTFICINYTSTHAHFQAKAERAEKYAFAEKTYAPLQTGTAFTNHIIYHELNASSELRTNSHVTYLQITNSVGHFNFMSSMSQPSHELTMGIVYISPTP